MILEVAILEVKLKQEQAFEAAFAEAQLMNVVKYHLSNPHLPKA